MENSLISIILFLQIFISVFFISISGYFFRKVFITKNHTIKFEEDAFFGFIFIGLVSLFINFFFPLTKIINTLFFILIILAAYYQNYFKRIDQKIFKSSILISLIAFILILSSTVNRPDAWLYHLPYSRILNDYKIIIGAGNLDPRFSHISIFQYIASFFNNYIFSLNGILIPISLVSSFFFIYSLKTFSFLFKEKKRIPAYIIFILLLVALYSFNRYSEYGNDAQPHIYYILITIFILKNFKEFENITLLKELSILSLFTFLMKSTFLIVSFIPFVIFILSKNKKKFFKSIFFFIYSFIFILWLIKNFLISGCLIYPINFSCSNNVLWKSKDLKENILTNEAWSKGWPDYSNKKDIKPKEYIKNFNWIETWFKNHFKYVFEKILPIILFIIINFFLFYFSKALKRNIYEKKYLYLLIFNILFSLIWFLKFPVYRLGVSQLILSIIFIGYFIFFKNIQFNNPNKSFKVLRYITFIFILIISIKNLSRVYEYPNNPVIPNVYTGLGVNKFEVVEVFNSNMDFVHYMKRDGKLCGYVKSPCARMEKNLKVQERFGYLVYY